MKYYIVGNGGFAKEVLFLCKQVYGSDEGFGGFIDYKPAETKINCMDNLYPVIDEDQFLEEKNFGCNIYMGIGEPNKIHNISDKFRGYNFPNLIHQNVIKDESVKFGIGNIITSGCILTVDILFGNFNIINLNVTIGHDTQIKDFNVFNPGANISGSVTIGCSNLFGTNSTVLQGINIGSNSIIGASSLVNKNVNNNSVVVGVPAKEIKKTI